MRVQFQSTHSLRSATPKVAPMAFSSGVSIHALLAECDDDANRKFEELIAFQSTHSLRSATIAGQRKVNKYKGFNPRTPCGVRHVL